MSSVRGARGPLSSPFTRLVFAIACVVLLAAFSRPVDLPRTRSSDELSYAFTDARPKKQLKSGMESRLVTRCMYGSYLVGNQDFTPRLDVLLNDALMTRLAEPLAGKQVTLLNFTVHLNDARALRQSVSDFAVAMSPAHMVADAALNRQVVGCAPDDYQGGYSDDELGGLQRAPWVLVVEVDVDGQRFRVRHLVLSQPGTGPYRKDLREFDLGNGLNTLFAKLTDQIAAAYAPASPALEVAAPVAAGAGVPAADPAAAPAEAVAPAAATAPAEAPAEAPAAEAPPSP